MAKRSFRHRVEDALDDRYLRISLSRAANILTHASASAEGTVPDLLRLRAQAKAIREHTLSHLADYLEQLEKEVRRQGGHVYWAADAAQANRYIVELAQARGAHTIAHGSSNTLREMDLPRVLREAGLDAHPSTVGDFMLELTGRPASHLVFSALQLRKEDVSQALSERLDVPPTLDIASMTSTAAARIRRTIRQADMSISGVSFAVAETGSLVLAENQGNERLLSSFPRIHVLVIGLEKVVPTLEDLLLLLQAHAHSSRGQSFATYTTLLQRAAFDDDSDGPRELHLILLDNGRTRLLEQGYGSVLTCIRCGACLNICPVYREIGGEAYGWTYMGPIGAVLAPLRLGIERAASLPTASTGCLACRQVCPVDLDLPGLLHNLRVTGVQRGRASWRLRLARRLWRWAMQNSGQYQSAAFFLRCCLRPLSRQGWLHTRLPLLRRWTAHQPLPTPARQSFRDWWRQRERT